VSKQVKATARVRVMLEIATGDHWGSDCGLEQVMKQGKDSALGALRNLIERKAPASDAEVAQRHHTFKLVGEPEVIAVLVEEDRR
jgi:hypothetical protein